MSPVPRPERTERSGGAWGDSARAQAVALAGCVGAIALLGWDSMALAPLRALLGATHEAGHALVAVATGGEVVSVTVDVRGGGATLTRGGWALGVLNGGYLGTTLASVALLEGARRSPRATAVVLGLLQLLVVAWMPTTVGAAWLALVAFLCIGVGWGAHPSALTTGLRCLGVLAAAHALLDGALDAKKGDAVALAARTGTPSIVWTVGWTLVGAGLLAAWVAWDGRRGGGLDRPS